MSQPQFPENPGISREDAINQILSSIAAEELGLSHILNAEGEKLQYILGTLSGVSGPNATIDDVLNVNKSIKNTLSAALTNQLFLNGKMKAALNSAVLQGPTGPTGPGGGVINGTALFNVVGTDQSSAILQASDSLIFTSVDNTVDAIVSSGSVIVDLSAAGGTGATGSTGLSPTIEISDITGNWIIDEFDTGVSAYGEDGATGATGADGLSPTIEISIITGNWVINEVDTGMSSTGDDGAPGATGADGLTPTIEISDITGNWIINEIDTGMSSTGDAGATGATGAEGFTPTIEISDLTGNWVINDIDTGVPAYGEDGATGATGATGARGATGATGATGAYIKGKLHKPLKTGQKNKILKAIALHKAPPNRTKGGVFVCAGFHFGTN